MKYALVALACLLISLASAQDRAQLYDRQGNPISLEAMIAANTEKTHIFFGEQHGLPEAHQFELKLLEHLYDSKEGKVTLGMEMFEADVQPIIEEYFENLINQKSFENEARIWKNYSDYQPLVEFAKSHNLQLLATNVPRRYANAVYHHGLSILGKFSAMAQTYVAPLPLEIDSNITTYREMATSMEGHQSENMVASQALKDATMADRILKFSQKGFVFLHINGAYHSKAKEGIISYLSAQIPAAQMLTIHTVTTSAKNLSKVDFSLADYTLVVKASKKKGKNH